MKELNKCHAISNQDRTLTLVIGGKPWACGVRLPVEGCYSLSMRVARGRDGNMTVGVCNAACDRAWGLDISTGEMVTFTHEDGLVGLQPMSDASGRRPTRLA